jgi:hypothetical protein
MVSCTYLDANQTYNIGSNDALLYILDTSGIILSKKIIGGTKGDDPKSIMPYRNGYGVIGTSKSYSFTEGVNENANHTNNLQTDIFLSEINDLPLNVNATRDNGELKLYPNPARDKVRIELPANDVKGTLTLKDAQGKTVYKESVNGERIVDVNISGWARGTYIVQWQGNNSTTHLVQKLVLAEY